jgi:FkbM family methyltransferase
MQLNTAQKIKIAQLASSCVLLARRLTARGTTATVQRGGLRWQLDLQEGIDFSIYLLGAFEPSTVRAYSRVVSPGATILDIGANVGAHTLFLARLCGAAGRVVAFEPTQYAFNKLRRNIELNPDIALRVSCQQVMLVATASSAIEQAIYSSWPLQDAADEELHAEHKGRLMVTAGATAETLDGALARLGVHQVDFVKLDVDGHEAEVLEGGRETFSRDRPAILMELAPFVFRDNMEKFTFMLKFFWALGYRLTDLSSGKVLPENVSEIIHMIPENGGINVLGRGL